MPEAYIYDAVRTPRGKGSFRGALAEVTPTRLAVHLLEAIRERNDLDTSMVEDVILGCVTQIGEQGANVAKTAAQEAGYADTVAAVTLNRFCASGLEAVNQAAAYVMSGQVDLLIAGGVESMSRAKMGSDGGAIFMDPAVAVPQYFVPQGISADLIATMHQFKREDVDHFGMISQQRANSAWEQGRFDRSVIPVQDINGFTILDKDENLRPQTTLEGLGTLTPSFQMMGQMAGYDSVAMQKYPQVERIDHVHHAGNSSAIVDGSGMMLIGSKEIGQSLGLKPRAKIRGFAVIGTEPTIMLVGPAPASKKALKRAGLSAQDIDLFEVNEAFAAVVMRFMEEMEVSHDRVNVNGGAIAMGHPLGATGCIIAGTLLDELERQDKALGLASLCVGGGMGIATIIERV
ncbi:acetyl-CoA C-acetyltransferase [Pontibacter sp. G13]|uniref:acetyl-CoA C-acetyltransferase n=1 Tax=Pontibacter sp. G13 TaxID=3074898 RepID=UPI00288AD93A|nr:acetyl-CoA C-acetyltransferase [Pontibacter sp. G13]WNJ18650.1 acetyl-CoA C-acetyltransferase [Pontibacter sp. G13]